jgi:putative endonuclease
MSFHVYILANFADGPMYVGHTDDIGRRIYEHREEVYPGFTQRYRIKRLVWMEEHPSRESAFFRERTIKRWRRAWKNNLVREMNPNRSDLFDTLNGGPAADPGQVRFAALPG